jgi:hypothetical protein
MTSNEAKPSIVPRGSRGTAFLETQYLGSPGLPSIRGVRAQHVAPCTFPRSSSPLRRKNISRARKRGKLNFLTSGVVRVLDQKRKRYALIGIFDVDVTRNVPFDASQRRINRQVNKCSDFKGLGGTHVAISRS